MRALLAPHVSIRGLVSARGCNKPSDWLKRFNKYEKQRIIGQLEVGGA